MSRESVGTGTGEHRAAKTEVRMVKDGSKHNMEQEGAESAAARVNRGDGSKGVRENKDIGIVACNSRLQGESKGGCQMFYWLSTSANKGGPIQFLEMASSFFSLIG